MQCPNPKCNQPNRAGAKFCTRCGMPFSLKGGAYTIIRPLGKGGMGAVYLAQQVIAKHPRPVVVKEMIPYWDPADPQGPQKAQQRFEDEAVTLVKLNHSGIPKIYDYFTEGGRNFIVMEYVEGRDLEQGLTHEDDARNIIPGKPYPPAQAARWAISLCRVLEYLATQSPVVIHHDIKPANIILDKNTGEARLVDFGTAKMKLAAGGQVGQQQSSVYGTQGYAPPEQYDLPGNPPRTEPRSDVYALAVTLYHLLTDDDPRPPHKPFDFPRLSSLSGTIRQTLATALEYDVNKRPTATQWRQQWEMLAAPQAASPFTFRSGDTAQTPAELVPLCDRHWDDGRGYLYGGQFERWFEGLNRHDLADKARDIRQRGGDQDAGLEEFLHELDPNLPPPNPQIAPQSLDFGALAEGQTKTLQLTVRNAGRGYARVDVRAREKWLAADKTVVGVRAGQSAAVQVTADASKMPPGSARGTVEVGTTRILAMAHLSFWRTVWARHPYAMLASVLGMVLLLLGVGWWAQRAWRYHRITAELETMVEVPAGEFPMGSNDGAGDKKPVHTVYLDAYQIDKYEVTNAQYRECLEAGACREPRYWDDRRFNAPLQPVVGVDWEQARTYCEWAGKRLPTEAEWEKAARGTDGREYPWGDSAPDCDKAQYGGCDGDTVAVGSKPAGASPYGAEDMAGNVWEWTADWYDDDYYASSPARNPTGPTDGSAKVVRGGSWYGNAAYVRTAYRYVSVPTNRYDNVGVRCAQDASP